MQDVQIRGAIAADIPFLATIQYAATLPPLGSFWDLLLMATSSTPLKFIEAMLQANASHWGNVADFLVLEYLGQPVAGAAGYLPGEDYRPLDLTQLGAIAQSVGWSMAQTDEFRDRYWQMFGAALQPAYLAPSGDWVVEYVAVLPEARGKGFAKTLLEAVLAKGRSRGCASAGISIINGNEAAAHLYESLGFQRYQTFYADYFDGEFPGMTKFRCQLRVDESI